MGPSKLMCVLIHLSQKVFGVPSIGILGWGFMYPIFPIADITLCHFKRFREGCSYLSRSCKKLQGQGNYMFIHWETFWLVWLALMWRKKSISMKYNLAMCVASSIWSTMEDLKQNKVHDSLTTLCPRDQLACWTSYSISKPLVNLWDAGAICGLAFRVM